MNEFVERLRLRDTAAWAELYDRHMPEIFGYVFRLVGRNSAVAEEVVQETWMNSLRGIDRFDAATDQVRGWLFAIARSQVALHFRRKNMAVGAVRSSEAFDAAALSDDGVDPSDELQRLELVDVVQASLLELSESYRELLLAKYVDRKSVSQLAAQHGKTDKAIEGLLARARAELRYVLAWYFPTQ